MLFKIANDPYESGGSQFVRYMLTTFLVVIGYILGQIPLGFVVVAQLIERDGVASPAALEEFANNIDFASINLDANSGLLLILLSFVGGLMALWFGVAVIHKRKLKTLITPFQQVRWGRVGFGFGIWFFLLMILEIASYLMDPSVYVFQLDFSKWLPLMAITIFILPLQTSFEELFFRGYLLQGIGLATDSRLAALVVTSIAFGAMHLMNPEIKEFGLWIMMPYYIGMGAFLGILTLMDEGLELALGIHAANNMFGATFVTFTGSALQTDAIFRVSEVNTTFMVPVFYIIATGFIYLCARKYGWTDWSKVFGSVRDRWIDSGTEEPFDIA